MAPSLALSVFANATSDTQNSTIPEKPFKSSQGVPGRGTAVLHPSQITTDFDLLRFEAAALNQLRITFYSPTGINYDQDGQKLQCTNQPQLYSLLVSSPYNNSGHYLDLNSLDGPNLVFSKALTALKPARADYATAPYTEALNLDTVVELVKLFAFQEGFQWKERSFYVVVFRSKLKENIDEELLYKLDYESHGEACESGGLLKYWFGKVDGERRNLATCEFALVFPRVTSELSPDLLL
jgi:hypothetical protein